MIQVKNASVLRELLIARYHPILIEIMLWLLQRYNGVVIITSGYREYDKGVHGTRPCRGIDIRSRNLKLNGELVLDGRRLCAELNAVWIYDPKRLDKQCAMYHDIGTGYHIHIQAHKNTIMK